MAAQLLGVRASTSRRFHAHSPHCTRIGMARHIQSRIVNKISHPFPVLDRFSADFTLRGRFLLQGEQYGFASSFISLPNLIFFSKLFDR